MSDINYYSKNKFSELVGRFVQDNLLEIAAIPAMMLSLYPFVNSRLSKIVEENLSHMDVSLIEAEAMMGDWDLDDKVAAYAQALEEKTNKSIDRHVEDILEEISAVITNGQEQVIRILEQAANMPEETREVWLKDEFEKLISI